MKRENRSNGHRSIKTPKKLTNARWAAAVAAGLGLAHVAGAANSELDVKTTSTDLTSSSSYTQGTAPTTTSDVTFTNNAYGALTFAIDGNTNLSAGTLNDLDATQSLTITNGTASTSASLTLNGGGDTVFGSSSGDLLYVASGANLTIKDGNGALGLVLNSGGNFNIAGTATINSAISGSNGFAKTGSGTLTLSGNSSYIGTTTVSGGTLSLTGSLSASGLVVGGGTFSFDKSGTNTQAFTTTTIKGGPSAIKVTVATDTLDLGTLSYTAGSGGWVNFSTGTGTIKASATLGGGILGGWATTGNSGVSGATADWATIDGNGNVVAYTGYTDVTSGSQTGAGASSQNWRTVNTGAQTDLTAGATINSLVVRSDFNVASGATMTLGSGGLILSGISRWIKNNGNGNTSGTGQITSGVSELFIDVASSTSDATNWRIWTKLVDNGSPVTLVKNGPGYLRLENANTYSGGTVLNGGTIFLSNNNVAGGSGQLGSGAVTLNSGTLNLDAATLANNFVIPVGAVATIDNAGNNGTLNGNFSGGGTVTLQNSGGPGLSENMNGSWSGFTGTLNYNGSASANNFNIFVATNQDLSNAAVVFSNPGNRNGSSFRTAGLTKLGSLAGFGYLDIAGTIEAGNLNSSTAFSGFIRDNGSAGTFVKVGTGVLTLSGSSSYTGATRISNGTLSVGTLANGGAASNIGQSSNAATNLVLDGGTLQYTGASVSSDRAFSITAAKTATIEVTSSGTSLTLAGATGTASTGGLTKTGAGILTLAGTNTNIGLTSIDAGTLKVLGSLSSSGSVAIGAGTLAGPGSVGATTVTNASAAISNGNANTTALTLASLAFNTGGTLNLSKANDLTTVALAVTGNLTTTSGIVINVASGPTWTNGSSYRVISYGGTFTGSNSDFTVGTLGGLGARQAATVGNTGGSNGFVTLTINGDTPFWTGAENSNWSTAVGSGAKDWKLITAGTTTDFLTNDQVLFDDNATGSTSVNISSANVAVASVIFNNSSKNYTISSTGGFGMVDGSGAASLTMNGSGTVTLTTTNGYTGATLINSGTLQLGDGTTNGDIATSSGITDNGALILNRASGTFTYANAISGNGSLTKSGAGTQILTGTGNFTGVTTISGGTLQLGNAGTTGSLGNSAIVNNGTLTFSRSNNVTQGTDFGSISGSGLVIQSGGGTVTLSNANSYAGGTSVSAGTVVAGNNSALGTGTITLAGGTLKSGLANLTLANNIAVTATSTLDMASNNTSINGNLSGSGALNLSTSGAFASTLNLNGDNSSYGGTITFNNNNAVALNNANAGSAGAAWVFNDTIVDRVRIGIGNATINFGSMAGGGQMQNDFATSISTISEGALNTSTTFSGTMKDNGTGKLALTKVGSGVLTLTGGNVYSGMTAVTNGTLLVNGTHTTAGAYSVSGGTLGGSGAITTSSNAGVTVLAGGKLAPGSAATPGKLTLNLGSGSADISGADAASNSQSMLFRIGTTANSDKIQVTGDLNIGTGTLEFNDFVFSDVGSIQANTTYTLVDATSITGTLGSVVTGTFGPSNLVSGTLSLDQANGDLLLNVASAPEPGSLALLAMGATGMLARRRRKA